MYLIIHYFMNTVRIIMEMMIVLFICLPNVYIIILLLMSTIKINSSRINNYLVDLLLCSGAIQNTLKPKLSEIGTF